MGKVFLARDTRLNRDVALKVLPDSLAADRDRLARFDREAQVLASLNHPNIAHLYGIEDDGPTRALVMELVGGPTLAERLRRGRSRRRSARDRPPDRGGIGSGARTGHRAPRPETGQRESPRRWRGEGAGFRAGQGAGSGHGISVRNLANSPTLTARATEAGIILGTAAYMSPEQAKGKPVDKRADIWAFGVVLYEMLAGRTMFGRENVTETLAEVILKNPDWSVLPPGLPTRIRDLWPAVSSGIRASACATSTMRGSRLTRRCTNQRQRRFRRRRLLRQPARGVASSCSARSRSRACSRRPACSCSRPSRRRRCRCREWSSKFFPPQGRGRIGITLRWIEMSPDGRHLAFAGMGLPGIFVRSLDAAAVRTLVPPELLGALPVTFFWSADGESIAFFAGGKLQRSPLAVDRHG